MVVYAVGRRLFVHRLALGFTLCATGTALLASRSFPSFAPPSIVSCKEETTAGTEEQAHEECDCAPLWECMVKGGECTDLDRDLRECMARSTAKLPK